MEPSQKADRATFHKDDSGKSRPDLIPSRFLLQMGLVMAHGAAKYGVDNWRNCDDPRRYEAAAMRHLLAHIDGERLDPDPGLPHLCHCACSLAMLFGVTK